MNDEMRKRLRDRIDAYCLTTECSNDAALVSFALLELADTINKWVEATKLDVLHADLERIIPACDDCGRELDDTNTPPCESCGPQLDVSPMQDGEVLRCARSSTVVYGSQRMHAHAGDLIEIHKGVLRVNGVPCPTRVTR